MVGVAHQLRPGDLPVAGPRAGDHAAGEPHVRRMHAELGGGHHGQALADLVARVLDRAAVEVGPGAGRGGRGVRDLVGAGRGEPHRTHRHAERGRRDLDHLGVQALAHLGAAVVDQHRAVLVDVHQRAGLVERGEVERDAELDRGDGEPALGVRVRRVERGHLGPPARRTRSTRRTATRSPRAARRAGPAARTASPGREIEVPAPQLVRFDPERGRAAVEDVLDDDHALRAAEAAERGVRGPVGLGDAPVDLDVGNPVRVVDVAQRPGQHRLGQVQAPAAVGGQRGAQRAQPLIGVEAGPPRWRRTGAACRSSGCRGCGSAAG